MPLGTLSSPRSPTWVNPFPNNNSRNFESLLEKPGVTQIWGEPKIPIQPSDQILTGDLSLLVPTKTKDSQGWSSVQTTDQNAESLLKMIESKPAQYKGKVTPESLFGCHLVARKLGDKYDPKNKQCVRNKFVRNDYFGIIALEESKNRTLIAMDKDWILPVIGNYFKQNKQIGGQRVEMLREYLATLNPVMVKGTPYIRWGTKPEFTPRYIEPEDILNELSIYKLRDPEIGYISEQSEWNQYDSSIMMIFAPVNRDVAESILTYTYREKEFYSATAYLTVFNLLLSEARDFEYLFPVSFSHISNAAIFSTEILFQSELNEAFYNHGVSKAFPRLNPKVGCFASFLLAESTYYNFPISWENNILTIKDCGYIQGQDIISQFAQILVDIRSQGVKFQEIPNFLTARQLASTTDVKCFPFEEKYYVAVPKGIQFEEIEGQNPLSVVELRGPLQSMTKFPKETREYLSSLGYMISKSEYEIDLDLGYRTYQQNDQKTTVYYYLSTHEAEMEIHQSKGGVSSELFKQLEFLLRSGFFFSQRMKNITSAYPGFIPGYSPLNRGLSNNVEKALIQINSYQSQST